MWLRTTGGSEVNLMTPLLDRARRLPHGTHLRAGGSWRLLTFAGPVLGATALGGWLACRLTAGEADPLRWPLLGLLTLVLFYLGMIGWPGMLGGLLRTLRQPGPAAAAPAGQSRTAILLPIHNEDPRAVFTAIAVMARAISEHGLQRVAIHVLSDTQDAALASAEEQAAARLQQSGVAIRYRRRSTNAGRKAGNIAEFCAANGAEYDYMLVLDADSLMSAGSIATLIGLMDANPRAGIIQTVPYPVGRETLFARIQQFSARLYSPLLVEGLAFWQQAHGNYWGHNAIIRIAPFVAHCELPVLPGREPFGGEILCHDVVEAALMQRAGWEVWMAPGLSASYEALPANIVDYAQRERRWCQGNLQHLGVLGAPGLRPVGRYHMALGVMCYLSGAAGGRVLGAGDLGRDAGRPCCGGAAGDPRLGPQRAGAVDPGVAVWRQAGVPGGGVARRRGEPQLWRTRQAAGQRGAGASGGDGHVSGHAGVLHALHRHDAAGGGPCAGTLSRGTTGACRGPRPWRRMRFPAVAGAAWLAGLSVVGGPPLAWALSLLVGLAAATPFAVWSSRTSLGNAARRLGLFLTEDEVAPHPVLRAYQRAMAAQSPQAPSGGRLPAPLLTLQPAVEPD